MWDAYHGVAQAKLPTAQPVVDRFHVMKGLMDVVTKARRIVRNQADEATKAVLYEPLVAVGRDDLLVVGQSGVRTGE
jgi:transposase